jgi:adenylate cyclase
MSPGSRNQAAADRLQSPARTSGECAPPTDPLLRDYEVTGEKIIAWIRLSIGATLALALGGSTELVDAATGLHFARFEQNAILAIIGFAASGFIGLALASPSRWRPSYAYAFVLTDVALVLLALAAAIQERALPGNAIPGLPILWAAPLLLAVGALRYDHRTQLLATALFGFGLILLAIGLQAQLIVGSDLARPWAGLFSLPSNVMRLVLLVFGGIATALAVWRSRQLLDLAVREAVREANLARFLPAEVAQRLAAGEHGLHAGRRQALAILFVDMRDATTIAETMAPERLSIFLSSFRRRVMRTAVEHGGVIDKFIGDGALLLFGIPEPGSQDAANALNAARQLVGLVERWNMKRNHIPPVRIGIGIHYGEAFCGVIGEEVRLEFTALGDAVNVAARLEQATKRYGVTILASEAAVDAAGERALWRELGREPLLGRIEPLDQAMIKRARIGGLSRSRARR